MLVTCSDVTWPTRTDPFSVMYKKLQTISIISLLFFNVQVYSKAGEESKRHVVKWRNFDGTLDDPNWNNLVYEIDGKSYPFKDTNVFSVPDFDIRGNSIIDVYFPKEAKINRSDFYVPLARDGLIQEWLKSGVKIVYHYKGRILSRHILIYREPPHCDLADCAEVSFDGIKLGVGDEAFEKLKKMKWESPTFLTIRFIHEYPQYPNGPVERIYGGGLTHELEQQHVIIEYSYEYSNDGNPWLKK